MSLLSEVEARLRADDAFLAGTSGRIGTTRRLAALPGVTMQTVSGARGEHFKGAQPATTMVQVDIWARSEPEAAGLREQAIAILRPAAESGAIRFQRAQVTNIRSGMESGTQPTGAARGAQVAPELYRESIDFIFTHTPG